MHRPVSVSAVGFFSLPFVDLFARAGVARSESEREILSGAQEDEGTDATYGAEAHVRLGSFALRLEYERFELANDTADSVSLGSPTRSCDCANSGRSAVPHLPCDCSRQESEGLVLIV